MNRKTGTLLSLGIAAALISAGVWSLYRHQFFFGYGSGRWNMPGHMMMGNGGMGILMILFWLIVVAAVVLLVSSALSGRGFSKGTANDGLEANEILKRRYARGEIDRTEFETMSQDLQH